VRDRKRRRAEGEDMMMGEGDEDWAVLVMAEC